MKTLNIIDSHTGGEPTRLVVSGGPDLGSGTLAERLDVFRTRFRRLARRHRHRAARLGRAWSARCCASRTTPSCAAGVIFFNNVGYLGMCGHGTIGLVVSLAHMGRIAPGQHRIETPVGIVEADAAIRTAASPCATCRPIVTGRR